MTTNNELVEGVEAARERCRSCLHSRRADDNAPYCSRGPKWSVTIVATDYAAVYPGDLHYFYDYYLKEHSYRTAVDAHLRDLHARVGPVPCPLYERSPT